MVSCIMGTLVVYYFEQCQIRGSLVNPTRPIGPMSRKIGFSDDRSTMYTECGQCYSVSYNTSHVVVAWL